MSRTTSPITGKIYGLERVCKAWEVSRSGIYARRKVSAREDLPAKRGVKPVVPDQNILEEIRSDIKTSPFRGEGHRKIHARVRRRGIVVGKDRVLRIMGENNLLSPHRQPQVEPNLHDGTIITDKPNVMWGTDGVKIDTVEDGLVWGFFAIEYWNAECMGWHICKKGDAQAALEPIKQGLKKAYGSVRANAAAGLALNTPQSSIAINSSSGE